MIHQYKLNGYSIVLDVNSGAVHVVDDCSYDILELLPREGAVSYTHLDVYKRQPM